MQKATGTNKVQTQAKKAESQEGYTIVKDDLPSLCGTKIDSIGECMIREKRYKSQGRGVRGLVGTTDRERDSGRGETNNELGRQGPTRSEMPKVKTHPLLAIVESNERKRSGFRKEVCEHYKKRQ